jgi:hypothetical protein
MTNLEKEPFEGFNQEFNTLFGDWSDTAKKEVRDFTLWALEEIKIIGSNSAPFTA